MDSLSGSSTEEADVDMFSSDSISSLELHTSDRDLIFDQAKLDVLDGKVTQQQIDALGYQHFIDQAKPENILALRESNAQMFKYFRDKDAKEELEKSRV